MNSVKSKLVLAAILINFSMVSGLFLESILGKWVHERYWNGTIRKVNETTAELADAFLSIDAVGDKITDEEPLEALQIASRHLVIELRNDNEIIWNIGRSRPGEELEELRSRVLSNGRTLTIKRRMPLSWSSNLGQWIRRPSEWMTPRFDFITVPFVFFSLLSFMFSLALVWRHRARYVEGEVKQMISEIQNVG